MFKTLYVTFVISLLIVAHPLWSIEYNSDLLQEMATTMKIDEQLRGLSDGLHCATITYNGKKLAIRKCDGRIEHIGIALFTPYQRKIVGQEAILNFIERYMLDCILPLKRPKSVAAKTKEDKVVFHKGSLSTIVDVLSSDTTYNFSSENRFGKQMMVFWTKYGKTICELTFPIDFELLNGTDMIENERRIVEDLYRTKSSAITTIPLSTDGLKRSLATGHYLYHGESYYTEQLNTNKYYEMDQNGQIQLIFDARFPLESISNLMTTTALAQETTVNMTMNKYGQKQENFSIRLGQLTSYMLKNGCKIFFGVMNYDGQIVTCELIYKNEGQGYHHVMKAEIDTRIIADHKSAINAILTTYLPTSRLMYLFDELKK